MISAIDALERLREGNRRFHTGKGGRDKLNVHPRSLSRWTTAQQPFAIVLGCSDSRVPVEIVFDQGIGDLFVVRVAGNVAAPSQVASIEFAATQLGARLVVVLGHSQCGAVLATIREVQEPTVASGYLRPITDRIQPIVEKMKAADAQPASRTFHEEVVRTHVRLAASCLKHESDILEQLTQHDGLLVVGAEYSLETGTVDFFDGVPGED